MCLDELVTDVVSTPCKKTHYYHIACLDDCYKHKRPTCPDCMVDKTCPRTVLFSEFDTLDGLD